MNDKDFVIMGYIRGVFGVRGWVKIHTDTEYADSLFDYSTWWIGSSDDGWKPYSFLEGNLQPNAIVAHLEGINDRETAITLRGKKIAVPRDELPPPEENEFYWADLIGLNVLNTNNELLGTVTNLLETGAHDVLVVNHKEKQLLIPFADPIIFEVNVEQGYIHTDWEVDYLD